MTEQPDHDTDTGAELTAVRAVLRIIQHSGGDLNAALQAVADTAARLCHADFTRVWLREGDYLIAGPGVGPMSDQLAESGRRIGPISAHANPTTTAVDTGRTVHATDLPRWLDEHPVPARGMTTERAREIGLATNLSVPLLCGDAVGVLVLARTGEPRPFSDHEIALAETFADQAVIAIENARLFTELEESNATLREALEQQTATAEVLSIISRAPTDVEPVLATLAERAARLCGAVHARIWRLEGAMLQAATGWWAAGDSGPVPPRLQAGDVRSLDAEGVVAQSVREGRVIHLADVLAEAEGTHDESKAFAQQDRLQTRLGVPLMREGTAIGTIFLARRGVRPFTPPQIALVETFADQAVIAIENARLFRELNETNATLREALEQQTATGEVLGVISRSPTDLQEVLDSIVERAARLCRAPTATLHFVEGDQLRRVVTYQSVGAPVDATYPVDRTTPSGAAVLERRTVCVAGRVEDIAPSYPGMAALMRALGWAERSVLAVPVVHADRVVAVLGAIRQDRQGFTPAQVTLVETFAAQAVIAMENARLFEEIQAKTRELEQRNREQAEALEREQATAEVLRVISRSPESLDVALQAVADTAVRLCRAELSRVFLRDGDFLLAGPYASPAGLEDFYQLVGDRVGPLAGLRGTLSADTALTGRTIHTEDVLSYLEEHGAPAQRLEQMAAFIGRLGLGPFAVLTVPMLRGSDTVGVLMLTRRGAERPFTEREIALAEIFSDQAVIAIENARLFKELQESNRELTTALDRQTATGGVLEVISHSPTDLQAVFDAIVERAARLLDTEVANILHIEGNEAVLVSGTEAHRAEVVRLGGAPPVPLHGDSPIPHAIRERHTIVIPDSRELPAEVYTDWTAGRYEGVSRVVVPLMQGDAVLGVLQASRRPPWPFTPDEVALVETFSRQAVIAIENARLFDELQQRNREQAEALEREQATAEVLRVISQSPEHLDDSLQAVADTACRLCRADAARVYLRDGDDLVAGPHASPVGMDGVWQPGDRIGPLAERGGAPLTDAALTGRTVHAADCLRYFAEHQLPAERLEQLTEQSRRSGFRTMLSVPLLRGSAVAGVLNLVRRGEPRPFSERENALAATFADQAVIAIENARLFRELEEQLEQQTATSRILEVISGSPTQLQPVLDAIVASAARLTNAEDSTIHRLDGDMLTRIASTLPESDWPVPSLAPFRWGSMFDRAIEERRTIRLIGEPDEIASDYPEVADRWRRSGTRSLLIVLLMQEGAPIGILTVRRRQPLPFTDKQIALLETFADQAVIAIQNTRLYSELQESNATLREALEQQTATADVLRIVATTPAAVDEVLPALLARALPLVGASAGAITRTIEPYDDRRHSLVTTYPADPARGQVFEADMRNDARGLANEVYRTLQPVQFWGSVADWQARYPDARADQPQCRLVLPLLREGSSIGILRVHKSVPVPFTDTQIALLRTFADQAVIAIENARLFEELQARNRDLIESLEHQTATADILRVISESPTDVQPVLQVIVERARDITGADHASILRRAGDLVEIGASTRGETPFTPIGEPRPFDPGRVADAAILERRTIHVTDTLGPDGDRFPGVRVLRDAWGVSSILGVPLWREGEAIGALVVNRLEVRPFTARQIQILETFARQAVIAMENVRLFDELQESNASLTAALHQQSAVAGVLEAISRAPTDVHAALTAIVEAARELVGADTSVIHQRAGERVHQVAASHPRSLFASRPEGSSIEQRSPITEAIREGGTVRWHGTEEEYQARFPDGAVWRAEHGVSARTMVAAPLFHGREVLGALTVFGDPERAFTDEEVALIETFAAQAAIAIQNARLFEELEQRNREQAEALEREQATAEILRVISRSPEDVTASLQAVADTALRLCHGDLARVYLPDGDELVAGPSAATSALYAYRPQGFRVGQLSSVSATIEAFRTAHTVHTEDFVRYGQEAGVPPEGVASAAEMSARTGIKTQLNVPLVRGSTAAGVLVIYRVGDQRFSDREVALAETFANQAVIAIENARLFEELQQRNREQAEALEREQATADILRVIAASTTDPQPVFDAIVASAIRLCAARTAVVYRAEEDEYFSLAAVDPTDEPQPSGLVQPVVPSSVVGRAILDRRTVHVFGETERLAQEFPQSGRLWERLGRNPGAVLVVPLLREGTPIGAILVNRLHIEPFTDTQIALLETFADQAVIAIENARLFEELQARNRDLTEGLERETATADVLRIISSAPTDLQRVLDAIVESAARLVECEYASIQQLEGEVLHPVSNLDGSPPDTPNARSNFLSRDWATGRSILERRTIHQFGGPEAIAAEFPVAADMWRSNGINSAVAVPLLRGSEALGTLLLRRRSPAPFPDTHIALLETFAGQAVIAIENARLFEELQQRNREQAEALEREQATAEVLRVISQSPENLDASLQAVADTATRLCRADWSRVWLREDDDLVAGPSASPTGIADLRQPGERLGPLGDLAGVPSAEAALTGRTIHAEDSLHYTEEHAVSARTLEQMAEFHRRTGGRTGLSVPLLRGSAVIGVLALVRTGEVRPFSEREIALAESFADQAVIAVENARLFEEIQAKNKELTEALEQQTATADVLRIISASPSELRSVFAAIAENAARLCEADQTGATMYDGALARSMGRFTLGAELIGEQEHLAPYAIDRDSLIGRAILERRVVRTVGDADLADFPALARAPGRSAGSRAALTVPLLRGDEVVGVIWAIRREERAFTDKQVAILETFASQAVIAIENVRLFEQLQARNREQAEALEREHATADVLRVIASSPESLSESLEAVAGAVARLCRADYARVGLREGDDLVLGPGVSATGADDPRRGTGERIGPFITPNGTPLGDAFVSKRTVHAPDWLTYCHEHGASADLLAGIAATAQRTRTRTRLCVPLLRADVVIGMLTLGRGDDPGPFSDREIALAETFADQAVIAIENSRLFKEIQDANRDLSEALEQQTATAEVLRIISGAPTDLQAVLDALVTRVVSLCEADMALLRRKEGDQLLVLAGLRPDGQPMQRGGTPLTRARGLVVWRALEERRTIHIPDYEAEPPEQYPQGLEGARQSGMRAALAVPLLREGEPIGAFWIGRREPRPFTDKHIALAETFAAQAVIAIENARLFGELQEQLDQQTAIAEILRAINASPADVGPVLEAVARSAGRLCAADSAQVWRIEGDQVVRAWRYGYGAEGTQGAGVDRVFPLTRDRLAGAAALDRRVIHIHDITAEPEGSYTATRQTLEERELGFRTMLAVPLLRADTAVGAITINRTQVRPFSPQEIALLQTFADQAAIALENARLFEELQQKNRELEEMNRQLELAGQHRSAFLANMSHELRTPLNAVIGYSEMLQEEATDLGYAGVVPDLEKINTAAKHLLGLINDILDLSKIEAGRMDLFFETFAIPDLVRDVAAVVQPLVAKNGNTLTVDCDPATGQMYADVTKVRQALFNLLSNAAKFTEQGRITLSVSRAAVEGVDWIAFAVRDTGVGIAPEQMERLFEAFAQADASTTRRYGGTGLGLPISRSFCRMMGGDIAVESAPGHGSTFTLHLRAEAIDARHELETTTPGPAVTAAPGAPVALVIDDDPAVRDLMQRFLAREGYTAATAPDGATGLRLAAELHPTVITLDVLMPGMDGWTVLATLKADPALADIPVIVLTMLDDRNTGYALRADEFMTKPVDRERLASILRRYRPRPSSVAVLIVEDDPATRELLRRTLEREGWTVAEAADGGEALARLSELRPGLILLDLLMPGMDGFAVVEALRASPEWRTIPVIVLTAKDLTDADRDRLNGDVTRILQKGAASRDALLAEVRAIIGSLSERADTIDRI